MDAAHALPAGYALQEYRIESLLGVGGFGLTYLATDQNLNLKVALKEYLPSDIALRAEDQSVKPRSSDEAETFGWGKLRFLDESRTLASFRHPNIVRVMRFFEANGSAYMVMEFVEGAPLPVWIESRRPLSEAQVAALTAPLLDGLELVHNTGFLHRDIKPGNIYVREGDSPVLLDFGSARQQSPELTAVVSPGYAPLEQYSTQGNQGPWSDIYAFAGVLYWMVTGSRPLDAIARMRTDIMPPAVQAGDKNLYRMEFLAALDWALSPNEGERPQLIAEWREALFSTAPVAAKTQAVPKARAAIAFDAEFLKRLEGELAQHLGPIAPLMVKNAAKKADSQADLVRLLAQEISDPQARALFEKRFSEVSRPVTQPATTTNPSTTQAATRFSPQVLDRAEKQLAQYIGPVARVVVKRAAMKARDETELYLLVADEIEDPGQKKSFTRKALGAKRG
jgi:serine/threonine protein kinase